MRRVRSASSGSLISGVRVRAAAARSLQVFDEAAGVVGAPPRAPRDRRGGPRAGPGRSWAGDSGPSVASRCCSRTAACRCRGHGQLVSARPAPAHAGRACTGVDVGTSSRSTSTYHEDRLHDAVHGPTPELPPATTWDEWQAAQPIESRMASPSARPRPAPRCSMPASDGIVLRAGAGRTGPAGQAISVDDHWLDARTRRRRTIAQRSGGRGKTVMR